MPARDIHHDTVKRALLKDGWTVTDDPLHLKWGKRDLYVDIGAERVLAAEKDDQKIAVEIKSFTGASDVDDLEKAVGQFVVYNDLLEQVDPVRVLFLAVSEEVWNSIFQEPLGQALLDNGRVRLVVFDQQAEVLVQWVRR